MTIAITGSMAFDYIMSFSGSFTDYILPDQLEKLSISVLVDSMRRERGGVAGNIAYTMALLKQRPLLMATVGQDGGDYINDLATVGVDTSAVLHLKDDFTASFFVSTDRGNRQMANFFVGAMARSAEISLHDYQERDIDLVIVSPSVPNAMSQYVTECQALGLPYAYDPSQQIPQLSKENLLDGVAHAYMLIVNEYEIELIKKRTDLTVEQIIGLVGALIVTEGERGSTIYANGDCIKVPIVPPIRVADPTGAGDAYRAGLLSARQNGLNWPEAGRMGALTATYALEEIGTQKHRYTVAEFTQRYRDNFAVSEAVESFFQKIKS